ncbi:hypothetical protein QWJ38_02410 [Pelomonas sp. PFR6]|uniref:Uncharacterized protein n=1 Tax=Roseateles violae TaxID=3058042 RepID=A0ABT8DS46_9BURK|nr:hypothetical protein [Pelomonas sp. PFR6]MDN3919124.1 hypothetical protein [Pelomonas sp. PFR6]
MIYRCADAANDRLGAAEVDLEELLTPLAAAMDGELGEDMLFGETTIESAGLEYAAEGARRSGVRIDIQVAGAGTARALAASDLDPALPESVVLQDVYDPCYADVLGITTIGAFRQLPLFMDFLFLPTASLRSSRELKGKLASHLGRTSRNPSSSAASTVKSQMLR